MKRQNSFCAFGPVASKKLGDKAELGSPYLVTSVFDRKTNYGSTDETRVREVPPSVTRKRHGDDLLLRMHFL